MSWQEPKTDWEAGDIPGPSDLNRIEENIQYLKDYVEKDGLFVLPSETVIMAADIERGGYYSSIVKQFRVKYEGKYRITCEARSWSGTAKIMYGTYNFATEHSIPGDDHYRVYSSDIYIPASEVIMISLHVNDGYAYVRNARVKGTLMTRSQVPANAVLQN